LAASDGGPYIEPTKDAMRDRTYPLTRSVYIYLNRQPGMPLDPKVREFLRYVLSREGQAILAAHGTYLPLTAAIVQEELKKLD
jgi:phosphate transport system substrate-binding protein